jgi:phytol kinase
MDILGLIISFIYIFFLLFISSFLAKRSGELARKFVHIGVSNWWILVIIFFNDVILASIAPALFVILNYISYKKNIFSSIERTENNSLGTVYYAVSCLVLTLASFLYFKSMLFSGIGIFAMGYGDGFAAILGTKFKSKKYHIFGQSKSLLGSLTMFVVTFIVVSILTLAFGSFSLLNVLIISSFATIIEALSPFGIDNLTVPLLTTLVSYFIL